MNYSLTKGLLALDPPGEESAFWTQMLTLAILAALVGIGGLIKSRTSRLKARNEGHSGPSGGVLSWLGGQAMLFKELKGRYGTFSGSAQVKTVPAAAADTSQSPDHAERAQPEDKGAGERDLSGGMEMLQLDFLLQVVENVHGKNDNELVMWKLTYDELVRRGNLDRIDSKALKACVTSGGSLSDKRMQYHAMKELAERTQHRSKSDDSAT